MTPKKLLLGLAACLVVAGLLSSAFLYKRKQEKQARIQAAEEKRRVLEQVVGGLVDCHRQGRTTGLCVHLRDLHKTPSVLLEHIEETIAARDAFGGPLRASQVVKCKSNGIGFVVESTGADDNFETSHDNLQSWYPTVIGDCSAEVFEQRDFKSFRFIETKLDEVAFQDSELQRAEFDGCSGRASVFHRSRLRGAKILDSRLPRAAFREVHAANAEFIGVELQEATFDRAQLHGAKFENADLSGASFSGSNLKGAAFSFESEIERRRMLGSVSWHDTICPDGTFSAQTTSRESGEESCLGHLRVGQ